MEIQRFDIAKHVDGPPLTPDWLVPNLIHRDAISLLIAGAGIGKSFLSYSYSVALATGSSFLGEILPESRVLYLEEENSLPTALKYLQWVWHGLNSIDKPSLEKLSKNFFFSHYQLGIFRGSPDSQWSALRRTVRNFKPHLIVVDTANPVCDIEDENDNGEASQSMSFLKSLLSYAAPGCAMQILKHAREGHVRGAKAWEGIADAVVELSRARGGRPDSHGWRRTILTPVKTRAFGLREELTIAPVHTENKGVLLRIVPNVTNP